MNGRLTSFSLSYYDIKLPLLGEHCMIEVPLNVSVNRITE